MKLIQLTMSLLILAPNLALARLSNDNSYSAEQEVVQLRLQQLLESVQGLTPEEVESAVNPVITDKVPMAFTPAVAAAVIVANAATGHVSEEMAEAGAEAPHDEQFDIQL